MQGLYVRSWGSPRVSRRTWNLRIHPWKRKNILQTIIFRFYLNLQGCNTALFPPIQLEVGISHQLQQHQQHVAPCQVTGVWCTSPAAQWRAVTWKRARSGSGEKVPLYSIWIICYPTGSYKYSSNQLLHTLRVDGIQREKEKKEHFAEDLNSRLSLRFSDLFLWKIESCSQATWETLMLKTQGKVISLRSKQKRQQKHNSTAISHEFHMIRHFFCKHSFFPTYPSQSPGAGNDTSTPAAP